ncbi:MAG: metal-sensitive transcriptional regulator [Nitrospinota bacterium]|nr:metal-sensitive transcriptional regulator [Nitrospinota bacterium]
MPALKRIEGQIRGIQKMIEEERYCVDILTQISSVAGALTRVQDKILGEHLNACVSNTLKDSSKAERQIKIDEVITLIKKFRKNI